ncbi:hypothetical protein ACFFX1_14335 [Dactylosporangium sucinum]|uniref:Uncharacterized protein n=1 Tax=Dactylosporangium sucinum TaxID=1424081 RepID=A0A917X3Y3_9ACTN|nr:hypothetical protein [Dactylosporangium sucinum]GGM63144.1 hypothetical protein GCM10007977_075930 [Dactylosporangium sucinum]
MGTTAVLAPPFRLDDAARDRLYGLGISVPGDGAPAEGEPGAGALPDLAGAIRFGAAHDALAVVVGGGREARAWPAGGATRLAAATEASAESADARPLTVVVLPATAAPRHGPVAVLSPGGAVSAHELYVGAALAAASGRRVEHVNGRGAAASAAQPGIPARAGLRAAVVQWRERAEPRPERSLHTLSARPAVIVMAVPPGSAEAPAVVAAHPDADVVLVFDAVHARHGAEVARQVAALIELAAGVGQSAPAARPAPPAPSVAPPAVRASDVIHLRLTDTALELTNRTRERVRLRVTLGSTAAPGEPRAAFETQLRPQECHAEPMSAAPGMAELTPPTAVLRHWSHGSAEVYEGGERRILRVEASVLDPDDRVRATRTYDATNGLDFSVTARDLEALLGGRAELFAEVRPRAVPDPPRDVLAALESALRVGATALAVLDRPPKGRG